MISEYEYDNRVTLLHLGQAQDFRNLMVVALNDTRLGSARFQIFAAAHFHKCSQSPASCPPRAWHAQTLDGPELDHLSVSLHFQILGIAPCSRYSGLVGKFLTQVIKDALHRYPPCRRYHSDGERPFPTLASPVRRASSRANGTLHRFKEETMGRMRSSFRRTGIARALASASFVSSRLLQSRLAASLSGGARTSQSQSE